MPYRWEHTTSPAEQAELHLWPHQSLSAHGFSIFILSFFLLALMPFFGLLGTVLLWGLLPFMLAAVAGLWFAIKRNSRDRQVLEILTLGPELTRLERHNPRGPEPPRRNVITTTNQQGGHTRTIQSSYVRQRKRRDDGPQPSARPAQHRAVRRQ